METNLRQSIETVPRISVVVPAYNVESYIKPCIDSLIHQSYPSLEIVVVDDGSSDATGSILDGYASRFSQVKVLHIPNGGVTNARLTGVKASSGDWIGFVDGDDTVASDMYERLIANALRENADISHCGYQTIVNNGERIHYFYNTGRSVAQDHLQGLRDLLSGEFVEPGLCNKLFRRELFTSLFSSPLLDTSIRFNEDLLMNYILFSAASRSIYEDFCPYHYYSWPSSATRGDFNPKRALDPVRVQETILGDVPEALQEVARQKYLVSCMNAYWAMTAHKVESEETKKLHSKLKCQQKWYALLSARERMKLRLLLLSPSIYQSLYHFYERHFQTKTYE